MTLSSVLLCKCFFFLNLGGKKAAHAGEAGPFCYIAAVFCFLFQDSELYSNRKSKLKTRHSNSQYQTLSQFRNAWHWQISVWKKTSSVIVLFHLMKRLVGIFQNEMIRAG